MRLNELFTAQRGTNELNIFWAKNNPSKYEADGLPAFWEKFFLILDIFETGKCFPYTH